MGLQFTKEFIEDCANNGETKEFFEKEVTRALDLEFNKREAIAKIMLSRILDNMKE